MFWNSKPTIDADEQAWQHEAWSWLLRNLGGVSALKRHKVAYPHRIHFPPSELSGEAHAEFVFGQVVTRFGIDESGFILECQDEEINPVLAPLAVVQNTPRMPLGTYCPMSDRTHVISYSPELLDNLESLIATFAHEICHPILLSVAEEPPGGHEAEEFATDLAMIFFGFGIFGANASFAFEQFSDNATGTQGWRMKRAGYLSQAEWGYGNAIRSVLTEEDDTAMLKFMSAGAAAHYKKNLRYLRKNKIVSDGLSENF